MASHLFFFFEKDGIITRRNFTKADSVSLPIFQLHDKQVYVILDPLPPEPLKERARSWCQHELLTHTKPGLDIYGQVLRVSQCDSTLPTGLMSCASTASKISP